jgi:hypothetical protein
MLSRLEGQLRKHLVWFLAAVLLFAGNVCAQDWRCSLVGANPICSGARTTTVEPQLRGTPLRRFQQALSLAPHLLKAGTKPCKILSSTLEPHADKLSVSRGFLTGNADTDFNGSYVMFTIGLQCVVVDQSISRNQPMKRRISESASHEFGIDCRNQELHYFAHGRDYYSDGSSMHWDSQGSGKARPWSAARTAGGPQRQLLDAICLDSGSKP